MKTTKVKCAECGTEFKKRNADYNRTERLGKRHFCCISCCTSTRNRELTPEERKKCYDISKHAGNGGRKDEYSPFKKYIQRTKYQRNISDFGNSDLDVAYLKTLWETQGGKCAYTKIQMILPTLSSNIYQIRSLKKASLDRIDSSKGYIKGNVHFVCLAINLAKKDFTDDEMKTFILEIKSF
jgi:hypothetical protein